jgi:hypothetical protein
MNDAAKHMSHVKLTPQRSIQSNCFVLQSYCDARSGLHSGLQIFDIDVEDRELTDKFGHVREYAPRGDRSQLRIPPLRSSVRLITSRRWIDAPA